MNSPNELSTAEIATLILAAHALVEHHTRAGNEASHRRLHGLPIGAALAGRVNVLNDARELLARLRQMERAS